MASGKLSIAILAAILWMPAAAQEQSDEIVVRAPVTADEIESASHAMARTLTAMTVSDQVPRWSMPICPRVEGLERDLAARVNNTIRTVGTTAGAKVRTGRCKPNVFVIFSNDSKVLAQKLVDRLPASRQGNVRIDRSAFTAATGPLRWESRVSLHDSQHGPLVAGSAALLNSGDYNLGIDVPSTDSMSSSLIRRKTRAAIDGMMVLVDAQAATGLELEQLAEYIAMVVVARPPMSASFESHPTILNLGTYRAPGPSSRRLSEWDRAYLAALYSAPVDHSASTARSLIAHRMTETLTDD